VVKRASREQGRFVCIGRKSRKLGEKLRGCWKFYKASVMALVHCVQSILANVSVALSFEVGPKAKGLLRLMSSKKQKANGQGIMKTTTKAQKLPRCQVARSPEEDLKDTGQPGLSHIRNINSEIMQEKVKVWVQKVKGFGKRFLN